MEAFFGISDDQAAASGLDRHDVEAGFTSAGVEAGIACLLAEQELFGTEFAYILGLDLGYRRLLGDAAESPIVDDEGSPDQFSASVGLIIQFGLF